MKLVNFLSDLFKEDGFRLIDANKREYLIGKPEKKNPLILELLDSSMHYKLCLLYTSPSPRDISGSRMPSSA